MEGVTILNSCNSSYKYAGIAILICGIFLLATFFSMLIKRKRIGMYPICIVLLIGIIFLSVGMNSVLFQQHLHTDYEVLIDETVSLIEFHEKYEIIDKRGDIWTVREIYKD